MEASYFRIIIPTTLQSVYKFIQFKKNLSKTDHAYHVDLEQVFIHDITQ